MEVAGPKREIRILLSAGESARIPKLGPPCKSRKARCSSCVYPWLEFETVKSVLDERESEQRRKARALHADRRLETNKLSDHKALRRLTQHAVPPTRKLQILHKPHSDRNTGKSLG
ncbi:hypothetical protein QLX08_006691 [Tetragonisca angustula]|uniref:Uncharacterized protein n=1 Tax=Tetragonisca angustula TaxID=166442 RepID=A0AAW0ZSH1_9HYME